jgi:hypothetical protein
LPHWRSQLFRRRPAAGSGELVKSVTARRQTNNPRPRSSAAAIRTAGSGTSSAIRSKSYRPACRCWPACSKTVTTCGTARKQKTSGGGSKTSTRLRATCSVPSRTRAPPDSFPSATFWWSDMKTSSEISSRRWRASSTSSRSSRPRPCGRRCGRRRSSSARTRAATSTRPSCSALSPNASDGTSSRVRRVRAVERGGVK